MDASAVHCMASEIHSIPVLAVFTFIPNSFRPSNQMSEHVLGLYGMFASVGFPVYHETVGIFVVDF